MSVIGHKRSYQCRYFSRNGDRCTTTDNPDCLCFHHRGQPILKTSCLGLRCTKYTSARAGFCIACDSSKTALRLLNKGWKQEDIITHMYAKQISKNVFDSNRDPDIKVYTPLITQEDLLAEEREMEEEIEMRSAMTSKRIIVTIPKVEISDDMINDFLSSLIPSPTIHHQTVQGQTQVS